MRHWIHGMYSVTGSYYDCLQLEMSCPTRGRRFSSGRSEDPLRSEHEPSEDQRPRPSSLGWSCDGCTGDGRRWTGLLSAERGRLCPLLQSASSPLASASLTDAASSAPTPDRHAWPDPSSLSVLLNPLPGPPRQLKTSCPLPCWLGSVFCSLLNPQNHVCAWWMVGTQVGKNWLSEKADTQTMMEREVRLWGWFSHMLAEAQHAPHCSLVNENSKGFFVELSGGLNTCIQSRQPGLPWWSTG